MPDVPRRILQARIPLLVYGAADPKAGAVHSLYRMLDDPRLNHRCQTSPTCWPNLARDSQPLLSSPAPAGEKIAIVSYCRG